MNITFLIGNGFDLNLGLSTSFSSFVNSYKVLPSEPDSKHIIDFKNEIKNNTINHNSFNFIGNNEIY